VNRIVSCLIAAAFLAACSQNSTGVNPTVAPVANAGAGLTAHVGPAFAISIVLPDGSHPHGTSATVYSLKAVTFVKKHKWVDIVTDRAGCGISNTSGTAGGCGVVPEGTKAWTLSSATFSFYSKAKAKGCILATASYKGAISPGYPLSLTFKAVNTKTCW
jgi:hypothetical protein